MAKAEPLRAVPLAVAGAAVDLLVRPIALEGRVERTMAFVAVVALLVPHRATGQLLLGRKHGPLTPRTSRASRRHYRSGVRSRKWSRLDHIVFTAKTTIMIDNMWVADRLEVHNVTI